MNLQLKGKESCCKWSWMIDMLLTVVDVIFSLNCQSEFVFSHFTCDQSLHISIQHLLVDHNFQKLFDWVYVKKHFSSVQLSLFPSIFSSSGMTLFRSLFVNPWKRNVISTISLLNWSFLTKQYFFPLFYSGPVQIFHKCYRGWV